MPKPEKKESDRVRRGSGLVPRATTVPPVDETLGERVDSVNTQATTFWPQATQEGDTNPDMDRPTRNYIALITQLQAELGSQTRAAEAADIDTSYISKLKKGERTKVGEDAISKACQALNLDRAYFTQADPGPYSDWIREPRSLKPFRKSDAPPAPDTVTPVAKRIVDAVAAGAPITPDDAKALADGVLSRLDIQIAQTVVAAAEAGDEKAVALYGKMLAMYLHGPT